MEKKFTKQEAFLALCLAIASQDNELNEEERAPLIKGMKETGLLDCEYELKDIFHSTINKISYVFKDGKAFNFNEDTLKEFTDSIKKALDKEELDKLFKTAVDIANADGILQTDTELEFLKKIHSLFGIEKKFNLIIKEMSET